MMTRRFPRFYLNLLRVLILLPFCVSPASRCAEEPELLPPDQTEIAGKVFTGKGKAKLMVEQHTLRIEAQAAQLGPYTENWYEQACVFDFEFPQPLPLPDNFERLGAMLNFPGLNVPRQPCRLRALLKDARGGMYALNFRMSGYGVLPVTLGYAPYETLAFDASELGRADPWVWQSLTPHLNAYDPPRLPLQWAGLRLILLEPEKPSFVFMRAVQPVARGARPDPYWRLTGRVERSGWGPQFKKPYLLSQDLGLGAGPYEYTREILDTSGWKVLESSRGEFNVQPSNAQNRDEVLALNLPLLSPGTYFLRLFVREKNETAGQELQFKYVVLRNSEPENTPTPASAPLKPLRIERSEHHPNQVTLRVQSEKTMSEQVQIGYEILALDDRVLSKGSAPASTTLTLDLSPYQKEGGARVVAKLQNGDYIFDYLWRLCALSADPAPPPPPPAVPKNFPPNEFTRIKGDWSEGRLQIVSDFSKLFPQFEGWLDDAVQTGYTQVEFPAPWNELEQIAGVYGWHTLDQLVAAAKKRGLRVSFKLHPRAELLPAWLPREYQMDQFGHAQGLWWGGGDPVISPASEILRERFNRFCERLAEHYRCDPAVLGYTLYNCHFDYGLLEMPWTGQAADYSPAMCREWESFLKSKYARVEELNQAHSTSYKSISECAPPKPLPFSAGPLDWPAPRQDRAWLDWVQCRLDCARQFRQGAIAALKRGDPGCLVGQNIDPQRNLYKIPFTESPAPAATPASAVPAFILRNDAEEALPPGLDAPCTRFTPKSAVLVSAQGVDLMLTNLLMLDLSRIIFSNSIPVPLRTTAGNANVQAAHARLALWFKAVERITGAQRAEHSAAISGLPRATGASVQSFRSLALTGQHLYGPRLNDYQNPLLYRLDQERVSLDTLAEDELTPERLQQYNYLYLPYHADVLTDQQMDRLAQYVQNGGRLILEASSGYWQFGSAKKFALGKKFNLPEPVPVQGLPGEGVRVLPLDNGPLEGVPLGLRKLPFHPPINQQLAAWSHLIPRAYFHECAFAEPLPGAAILVAKFVLEKPAVVNLKFGRGEMLLFAGTIDWLNSPGLARRLDEWGNRLVLPAKNPGVPDHQFDPEYLASSYQREGKHWLVGRRYVKGPALDALKNGNPPGKPRPVALRFPNLNTGKYQVTEVLSGKALGEFEGKVLHETGLELNLMLGEGFFLEAAPVK